MSMYRSLLAWVSLLALSVAALPHQESQCSEVTFAINAEAQNALYTVTPDPNNETDIVNFVEAVFSGHVFPTNGTQTVGGTFSINGIFCRPNIARHDAVLEILVHGITYNKTYWSGLGFGDYYNWQSFSSSRGYYSLAIDRLGHGTNAQHPDPCVLVEGALQIEIMHQLIGIVRSNAHSVLGQRFQKIAFVGHSYGSVLGVAHARLYPNDIDALVLTGYSTSIALSIVQNLTIESAVTLMPYRFRGLQLGYVATTKEAQREAAFYAGAYNHSIPQVDYAYEDTVTDGEVAGLALLLQPAVGFRNPVLIVTGVDDAIFCTPPLATCETVLDNSKDFFPNSTNFQYAAIPATGHCLSLHYSAPATFLRAHAFLDKVFGT